MYQLLPPGLKNLPIYGDCNLGCNTQDPALTLLLLPLHHQLHIKNLVSSCLGGSPHLMCTTCTALPRCNSWGNSLQVWVCSHSFGNRLQHSVSKGYERQDLILIPNFETFQETGIHYQIFGQFRKWICEHKSNKNKMHLNCHFFLKEKNLKTKLLNMLEVIRCSCFPSKTASFA